MIQINDNDSPITVAEKIITGTKPYNPTKMMRTLSKAITGDDCDTQAMFNLEDIKEIAEYLMVYYNTHQNRD